MQNGNKIKQVATKYQNWFENKPSGNPGLEQETAG
jgi:hypothetical protein